MNKKRKKRRKIIIISFIIIVVSIVLYFFLFKKVISGEIFKEQISNYPYVLETRDNDLMENTFNTLKEILTNNDVDYEKYAENLAKLFIIDFYSLDNKKSKYDVGGIECIYEKNKDSFILKAQDTIYNYFNKKNNYPEVIEINTVEIKETKYKFEEKEYDAYDVILEWNFNEDLGYDTKAKVTIVKIDNMLYVSEYKAGK